MDINKLFSINSGGSEEETKDSKGSKNRLLDPESDDEEEGQAETSAEQE